MYKEVNGVIEESREDPTKIKALLAVGYSLDPECKDQKEPEPKFKSKTKPVPNKPKAKGKGKK